MLNTLTAEMTQHMAKEEQVLFPIIRQMDLTGKTDSQCGSVSNPIRAMILTGPRVYYAMARNRLFFRRFARLSPSSNTPDWSIFLQAFLAIIMVLTATFSTLLIFIGFKLYLFACLTVIGMIVLRIKYAAQPHPYRTWGYPFAPLFFIVGNLWIVFVSVQSRPVASLFGLATIAAGILVYFVHYEKKRMTVMKDLLSSLHGKMVCFPSLVQLRRLGHRKGDTCSTAS